MTPSGQLSTHFPQRMHSEFSMDWLCTMALTSRLIEQFLVHVLQLMHLFLSASSCSAGQLIELRISLPITMKGAIQQMVWHAARLPAVRAKIAIAPAIAANIIIDGMSCTEIPFHVW
jgi:hypothetical protein